MKINLGCGTDIREGYTNVDCVMMPGVDQVVDLDAERWWPFLDDTVDEIIAYDIFEHVDDPLHFMYECGRILRPDGILELRTVHWKSENAYTDPTHRRFCTEHTFDYWVPGTLMHSKYGPAYVRGGAVFIKMRCELDEGGELEVKLRKI